MTKVTMNLTEDEIALITKLKENLSLKTNTGTVIQSLKIAEYIVDTQLQGKTLHCVDACGCIYKISIPGI